MSVTVLYFASLRERAGSDAEVLPLCGTPAALYEGLRVRHGFAFAQRELRVAVNGTLVPWGHSLAAGDEVAFIPPVSGG